MSDFIYCSKQQPKNYLKYFLTSPYNNQKVFCNEYHGDWGSVSAIKNHYSGYEPFENSQYIIFTTGGPVLNFDFNINHNDNNNYNNAAILSRWKYEKKIKWEDDLSGPFAIFCIDKINRKIELVSDLLLFIPIYYSTLKDSKEKIYIFGTHNDVVAKLANREMDIDLTSVADMLLNTTIVFPYTFHKGVSQLLPATVYNLDLNNAGNLSANTYWVPFEQYPYKDIDEAGAHLRESMLKTVGKITKGLSEVALFLSGGEDSRVILASLPDDKKKSLYFSRLI